MESTCKVCGKSFTNLVVHINKKHNMSSDEYKNYGVKENEIIDSNEEVKIENDFSDEEEIVVNTPIENKVIGEISQVDLLKNRLSAVPDDPNELLFDFLSNHKITKKELVELVKNYKNGTPVVLTQTMRQQMNIYRDKAIEYVNRGLNEYRIADVNVVDMLLKTYPEFKVDYVDRKSNPKVWVVCKK